MFGLPPIPWGPLGIASGSDTRPTNTQEDTDALQKLYATVLAHNRTPNGRVARGWDQFGPATPQAPMLPTPPTPPPVNITPDQAAPTPPVLSQAMASVPPVAAPTVPLPTPRPADAPQAPPPMSWFQQNAAMMRDPSTGQFIDPTGASQAQSQQASGPDVINKLLSYFHKEGNPS